METPERNGHSVSERHLFDFLNIPLLLFVALCFCLPLMEMSCGPIKASFNGFSLALGAPPQFDGVSRREAEHEGERIVREMRQNNALDHVFVLVPVCALAGVLLQLRTHRRMTSAGPSQSLVVVCAVSSGLLIFYAVAGFGVEHQLAKEIDENQGSIQAPVIVAKTAWFYAALAAAITSLGLAALRRHSPRLLRQDNKLVISFAGETPRWRALETPRWGALRWTMLVPLAVVAITGALAQFVQIRSTTSRLKLPNPVSGGYRQIELIEIGRGHGQKVLDSVTIVLTPLAGGTAPELRVSPRDLTHFSIDASGKRVHHDEALTPAAIHDWMRDMGVRGNTDALLAEATDVFDLIRQDVEARVARTGTSGMARFRGSAALSVGGGSNTPIWFLVIAIATWLLVWLLGLRRIFSRTARRNADGHELGSSPASGTP